MSSQLPDRLLAVLTLLILASTVSAAEFPLTPDSQRQPGVPRGEVLGPFRWNSEVYPGTVRNYWLYVPRQYDPAQKTCVFIVQDGRRRAEGWHVPTVLDNLIHRGEVPVQIGIFIDPGQLPPLRPETKPRHNRSFEYDSLGDRYARFLIEEILPEVSKSYNLSTDPNDAAIAGSSSGGICAMNAAWERPDRFRRVFSGIGTFAALRGGDAFPTLIRKYEGRPIRVFLQDGSNNANAFAGDGFLAAQSMLSALKYAGYEVDHAWGDGGHDDRHGAQVLPDALRFLWRDYPQPIVSPQRPKSMFHVDIPIPGEHWDLIATTPHLVSGLAANAAGKVFISDAVAGRISRIEDTGQLTIVSNQCPGVRGIAFDADGLLYACEGGSQQIVRFGPDGKKSDFVMNIDAHDLVLLLDGSGYATTPGKSRIWQFDRSGVKQAINVGLSNPRGITTSLDESLVMVSEGVSRFTSSLQIQSDGTLAHEQPYGWLHVPDNAPNSGAAKLVVDNHGLTYVASAAGIQILDGEGRMVMMLQSPERKVTPTCMTFGGTGGGHLFVASGNKVYKRRVNAKRRTRPSR